MSPRDYRAALGPERCWDRACEASLAAHGEALEDCILQNREELIGLCEFIEAHAIRSYLEIGVWTGRLTCALDRLFRFDLVAACDHGWAERCGLTIRLPTAARVFRGDSASPAYRDWRADLGPIDLVLIDANHAYHAVKRDLEINRAFPHRFLALHDISGARRQTAGVRRVWEEQPAAGAVAIVRPHLELGLAHSLMGIGILPAAPVGPP